MAFSHRIPFPVPSWISNKTHQDHKHHDITFSNPVHPHRTEPHNSATSRNLERNSTTGEHRMNGLGSERHIAAKL
jgi:hypothetical protein